MTVSVPLVVVFGILVFVACRYTRLRAWQAIVALLFGFLLAATTAAPEIRDLLSGLVTWLNKP
jgi:VanZ family protein